MFFARRRRPAGLSLTNLLVVGGVLYATGAGGWLLDRMQGIPNACYSQLGGVSPAVSRAVCGVTSQGVGAVTHISTAVGNTLDGFFENSLGKLKSFVGLGGSGAFDLPAGLQQALSGFDLSSLSQYGSTSEALSSLMQAGPGSLGVGSGPLQQLQAALDSMNIGQQFMAPSSAMYDPSAGLGWLQQGASQGEYGLMPQLSLGSIYASGANNIAADPAKALQYYTQALGSLQALQGASNPGAQQLVGSLPVSPAQMQKEIIGIIRTLKAQQ